MYPLLTTLLLSSVHGLEANQSSGRSPCENSVHEARPHTYQEEEGGGGLECVYRRKLVMLGGQGAGKSSLANSLLGWRLADNLNNPGPFYVGHGVEAGTLGSSYSSAPWLGEVQAPTITVVDTPGFNSSFDDLENLVWLLSDLEEINVFVIVFKHGDRFSSELARSLNTIGKLMGPIWRNTVVVVSHWSFDASAELRRKNLRINQKRCIVYLEERTIMRESRFKNEEKIHSQETLIQNLRDQIDILKTSCL